MSNPNENLEKEQRRQALLQTFKDLLQESRGLIDGYRAQGMDGEHIEDLTENTLSSVRIMTDQGDLDEAEQYVKYLSGYLELLKTHPDVAKKEASTKDSGYPDIRERTLSEAKETGLNPMILYFRELKEFIDSQDE